MKNWLTDLTSEVANLGKINDDEDRVSKIINDMVIDICQTRRQNIRLVREGQDFNPGGIGFMCAYPGEIHYSAKKIKDIKNAIINGQTAYYNPNYNDITYSLYLINSIYHEVWHCTQEQDIKDGKISRSTFFNALSLASQNNDGYIKIPYLERHHEGEAYGKGLSDLFEVIEASINISPFYSKIASEQLKELNFFSKNINFANVINLLDQIPFVSTNTGFENVINVTSRGLIKMPNETKENVFKNYPQLAIVYQANGVIKDPMQLMEQYFNKVIKHQNMHSSITLEEQDSLSEIYLYALMPQLTKEMYESLSKKYGNDNMDKFMNKMQSHIQNQKRVFIQASNTARRDINFINDPKLLQGISTTYVSNKGLAGLEYLYECENKIEEFINRKTDIKSKKGE